MIKFECGCIGFQATRPEQQVRENQQVPGEVRHLLIWACGSERTIGRVNGYDIFWQNMHGTKFEQLPIVEVGRHMAAMHYLIQDGYKFKELKKLLE